MSKVNVFFASILVVGLVIIGSTNHEKWKTFSQEEIPVYKFVLSDEFTYKTAHDFLAWAESVQDKKPGELHIFINSYGGGVRELRTFMYALSLLKDHKLITYNIGNAISCGAILWSLGEERYAADGVVFLYHKAYVNTRPGQELDPAIIESLKIINDHFMTLLVEAFGEEISFNLLTDDDEVRTAEEMIKLGIAKPMEDL